MILYFTDRHMDIIGQASTSLPDGLSIVSDKKTDDVDIGVSIFECKIPYTAETRAQVEACAEVGNYLLRSYNDEHEFYTIIETELDTNKQEMYIYAEDAGMDLLNDVAEPYEATAEYTVANYINRYIAGTGFQIGKNEIPDLKKKLIWDSESTAAERILSIAEQFDNAEISYSFEIDGLYVTKKYINIHKKRGSDTGVQLRLNKEIDSIVTTKTIANLATALKCTGDTPDPPEDDNSGEEQQPITLKGYSFDDGDFYVDGDVLKSRKALQKWSRLLWKDDDTERAGGHITRSFSYETLSQAELCKQAKAELTKIREAEANYDADILELPADTVVGDRINIIDDAGELYLSTRILTLEVSAVDKTRRAVLGEHKLQSSGISSKVQKLAQKFAKTAVSASRALAISTAAKTTANSAKAQAEESAAESLNALNKANDAVSAASAAQESAANAQQAASDAQAAVDGVEESIAEIEETVDNAQAVAQQAQQAAATAQTKADEAHTAAVNAGTKADEAKTAATEAQGKAETAEEKAGAAQTAAEQAKADAQTASDTAAAAKQDAEKAQEDIDSLGENLTTLSNTMQADYSRKTELTEATASLQSQITQNAAGITSTASRVEEIDETANNAKEQAQQAQASAQEAQAQADQAVADAQAAQTAANNAASAASSAQSEANAAKAAAEAAQSVADKAETDLAKAQADLATVQGRVNATEEEIAAAQAAVNTAQAAADKAKQDAQTAAQAAADAQSTADTAVTNAATAQTAADNAASAAAIAQATADAAKGDASAAQARADEAAAAAVAAQNTANTAVADAEAAQTRADEAAQAAADAQTAADDADRKAAAAQSDLDTAKQNLANVTSRVDATEEEIAAAQEAVETAQAAADKAEEDAAKAQQKADEAHTNAANAQTAANNAKTAADNAKTAADAAQAAADKAQSDVNALAVRVTTAETKITQNTEKIQLAATKTEVTQTLGGYYTKSEADAAITLKANEITQTVSETYTEKGNAVKEIHRYYMAVSTNSVLLPETEAIYDEGEGTFIILSAPNLIVGKTYTVTYNGVVYNCVAYDSAIVGDAGGFILGNGYAVWGESSGMEATDEPFLMICMPSQSATLILPLDGAGAVTVSIASSDTVEPEKPTTFPPAVGGSDTVMFNGNAEGFVTNTSTNNKLCKVSSAVPTVEDLNNGGSVLVINNGTPTRIDYASSDDLEGYTSGGVLVLLGAFIFIVSADNTYESTNFGTFPEPGVYFAYGNDSYVSSFTIVGYTGFESADGWSEAEPEYEQGKSLFTTDCTVYADGSFVYSDVSLSSAQEGANKAAAKTDALTERVSSAETSISQNTDQIALSATKTEVAEALDGYYTKSETEAELKVESDRISAVVESVSEVSNSADNNAEAIEKAYSMLNQLAESLSTLVVGEDGASLMKQTENGWQFDFGAIKKEIDDQFEVYGNHITFGEYDGKPCIKLNQDDSDFAVLITNEEILFMEGSNAPTKICDNTLVTENIEVKQELRQGGFVWVLHGGNLGLMWKGVDG